jgi:hypothetical protein
MIYSVLLKKEYNRKIKEIIILVPFIILLVAWGLFGTNIPDGYYMTSTIKQIITDEEFPVRENWWNFRKILIPSDWYINHLKLGGNS